MTEEKTRLESSGDRWSVSGSLTMDNVSTLLKASAGQPLPASGVIDLAYVQRVDSAAVALLLEWKRRAAAEGRSLSFSSVSPSMTSLAGLYCVEELLLP